MSAWDEALNRISSVRETLTLASIAFPTAAHVLHFTPNTRLFCYLPPLLAAVIWWWSVPKHTSAPVPGFAGHIAPKHNPVKQVALGLVLVVAMIGLCDLTMAAFYPEPAIAIWECGFVDPLGGNDPVLPPRRDVESLLKRVHAPQADALDAGDHYVTPVWDSFDEVLSNDFDLKQLYDNGMGEHFVLSISKQEPYKQVLIKDIQIEVIGYDPLDQSPRGANDGATRSIVLVELSPRSEPLPWKFSATHVLDDRVLQTVRSWTHSSLTLDDDRLHRYIVKIVARKPGLYVYRANLVLQADGGFFSNRSAF